MRRTIRAVALAASLLGGIASACSAAPAATPEANASASPGASSAVAVSPTPPPSLRSSSTGGGEPRTGGYWELWSTCGKDSQAATAAANGGRAAGWVIADDLLQDPGIEVGPLKVSDCQQGLALLHLQSADGSDHASDPVYQLAGQLYATELNLAVGSRGCDEIEGTVIAAQDLLTELHFDGTGAYLSLVGSADYVARVSDVVQRLATYNGGGLC